MHIDELLPQLEQVRRTPRGHTARCPAHTDKSPSLSVSEGERGILLKCWAGCTLQEICQRLGIAQQDLFFDALNTSLGKRREAARNRARARQERERRARKQGQRIDALKAADNHVRSRRGLDISGWNDQKLDDELNVLADAYALLASEDGNV